MNREQILKYFESLEGWFYPDEGQFLLTIAERAMAEVPFRTILEVGSYLGKSTSLLTWAAKNAKGLLYSVDPHEGDVTQPGGAMTRIAPTLAGFKANMSKAGLLDSIQIIQMKSTDVKWDKEIGLLFIDGLHDYAHVATDYAKFGAWVPENGFIAWHDYNPMWPDVMRTVDERVSAGTLVKERLVNSLLLTRKTKGVGVL